MKNSISFFQKGPIEIVDGEGTHTFPYHTHQSFLVGVVKSGEARFVIGDTEYLLRAGMTYLVPPDVVMSITPTGPYQYLTVCIKDEEKTRCGKPALFVIEKTGKRIIDLCEDFKSGQLSDESFMGELGKTLWWTDGNETCEECVNATIRDAVRYIREHVYEKFRLDRLAQNVHLSKYHLVRIFKNEMGVTPKQYDQQCKIRAAKKSILAQEREADIAADLYFSNQSHLCSMFKKYMGISLWDYRSSVEIREQ
jgi:AraC-like DNA-binding protein